MKTFIVPLADLERGPKQVVWSIEPGWLNFALEGSEADARGCGQADLVLTKTGRQVVVRGRVTAPVVMPCARTMEPVELDLKADVFLMLSPAASTGSSSKGAEARPVKGVRVSKPEKKGQRTETGHRVKDRLITEEEAAEDTYSGAEIVLDEFVREFILLELPMAPLRSDLRLEDNPAIPGPPEAANADAGMQIDPRLAPLAEIAGRLKQETKE